MKTGFVLGLMLAMAACSNEDDKGGGTGGGGSAMGGSGGGTGGGGSGGGTGGGGGSAMGGSGGGGSGGGGAGGSGARDGGSMGGTGGTSAAVTYNNTIKAIFMAKCGMCHVTGGQAALFHTMASSYTDVKKTSTVCSPKTKGECAYQRAMDKSMPPSCKMTPANCVTMEQLDSLQKWVAAGTPE